MWKALALIGFLILPAGSNFGSSVEKLGWLRSTYFASVTDAALANRFHRQLLSISSPSPIQVAYTGGVESLLAKHSWNPYSKMNYLKKADACLKRAVQAEPANIEIRFLRFSYEHYVPSFLGYSSHLDEDRKAIVQGIMHTKPINVSEELLRSIIKFLIESKRCSPGEVKQLRTHLH